jgi:arylsulfatase A-like enzyme
LRSNILYIHSHDTGRFIQPYGHGVATPHLQALAEQGVLFRQAFSAAPTCSPSRAGLLTGQCAHSSGMVGLAHRGFSLNDYNQHIAHTLRQAGYSTALIGLQHVVGPENLDALGYDRTVPLNSFHVEDVAPAATDFLKGAPRQPFFLSVGFVETHRPFHQPGPAESVPWSLPPAPLPDTSETRTDMAAFKASARILDQGIGAVLEALESSGLAEDTLVVCTTDHGMAFPGMKCTLTDHGTGVMLILRGPGGFEGGRACDALVSHVDLFPTLCDLLEIAPPPWLQGRSMMPLVRGEAEAIRDAVFAEVSYHAAYEPKRAVRTRRWKYIRRFGDRRTPVLPNIDDGPSKNLWLAHGLRGRPVAEEELYDLIFDPNEACNLAGDMGGQAARLPDGVLEEMRARLDRWMRETDDPLLHGRVPAPPGARVNDPDGLSPEEPPKVIESPQ